MKRKRKNTEIVSSNKRVRGTRPPPTVALLSQYYSRVLTLREYLCSQLPGSKRRARIVAQYGRNDQKLTRHDNADHDAEITVLLDTTLVGTSVQAKAIEDVGREIATYTQQISEDSTIEISPTQGALKQAEIVSFVVWKLFNRSSNHSRVTHLLCRGYQRSTTASDGVILRAVPSVPGVMSNGQSTYAESVRQHPWTGLPALLGRKAERIISNMLMECGIFLLVGDTSNARQISGIPMSELKVLRSGPTAPPEDHGDQAQAKSNVRPGSRGLSEIKFVRHRMFYARPSMTSKGQTRPGLSHVHALHCMRDFNSHAETVHCMKYIFPRQFGLHNVFTSDTDHTDTAQPFKDYTLREKEIAAVRAQAKRRGYYNVNENRSTKIDALPKRLRGQPFELVRRLRGRFARCPFDALLEHHCPRRDVIDTSPGTTDCASPVGQVSSYCRAVIQKVFPSELWGSGTAGRANQISIMGSIDRFIRLRRYESVSLHDVLQGVTILDIDWLEPPKISSELNISATDFDKRRELLCEFMYYMFDSFLIPLIRNTFHVTESGAHRNQLFYFRHDTWKAISAPALTCLKANMMEVCGPATIKGMLAQRSLGVSQIRLMPKEKGMRPIINLRRRVQRLQRGEVVLGRSINSLLTPMFSALNFEKAQRPDLLGSALFSTDDIFPRLQGFRERIRTQSGCGIPLYFAKVDVQSCFDTIPQARLMALVRSIIGEDGYSIAKYARAKMLGGQNTETPGFGARPSWRFLTKASTSDTAHDLAIESAADAASGRTRTVFVDGMVQRRESRKAILDTLEEHVQANLIRIGKRYYRQKEGIAQGSIVSSLLCSYLYADLERTALGFLNDGQTLLLRLIDDFLVISTDKKIADRFLHVMLAGLPDYGVQVKAEKTRANFDFRARDGDIARLPAQSDFPYCGNAINTVTLDIRKDRERRLKSNMADSVTVEYTNLPGQAFYRKILNALKLHMHAMLLSTKYNSLATVYGNIYHGFLEVAQKCYHYIRSLQTTKQPGEKLLIKTIDDTIKLACVLMKHRKTTGKDAMPYECSVTHAQTRWLGCTAVTSVFQRRQSKFSGVLKWLRRQLELSDVKLQRRMLERVVKHYEAAI
ncbi:Telomerase reverse transcriptase [Recurvomyces mirabilis]|uniref:Telomerase reverse transcriptase n=1 Tax=Recurvomyces mirabilis TaxID=574656 RepID=A0AAE0WU45_9PEZI|nr:Telomerase reverse transcriptase [Recurvomyces mirabilis]KAK5157409.1 Telomerase reverse transcriptase [Recurvomyces mirabilis]